MGTSKNLSKFLDVQLFKKISASLKTKVIKGSLIKGAQLRIIIV